MGNIFRGNSLDAYSHWAKEGNPSTIISDGAYGVGGFPGDPKTPEGLGEWYRPHIEKWSEHATAQTALWFWNTEVGWAETHPVLKKNGWKYVQTCTWNKGIGHIAGNVNGDTIRRFPVVTEICVLYQRADEAIDNGIHGELDIQQWLRAEWKRSGLPFSAANIAAGVKNAASRKWLASDHLFYLPPLEMMKKMVDYANEHGRELGYGEKPYFSDLGYEENGNWQKFENRWGKLRYQWNHVHGITNVWDEPSLRSKERLKLPGGKTAHLNQKPLSLANRIINATSNAGDTIWEPFGGTGTFAFAAEQMGRKGYVAESNPEYQKIIEKRFESVIP